VTPGQKISLGFIAEDTPARPYLANTLTSLWPACLCNHRLPRQRISRFPKERCLVVSLKTARSKSSLACFTLARRRDMDSPSAARSMCLFKICSTFIRTEAGNIGPSWSAGAVPAMRSYWYPAFPRDRAHRLSAICSSAQLPLNVKPLKAHPLIRCMIPTCAVLAAPEPDQNQPRLLLADMRVTRTRSAPVFCDLSGTGFGAAIAVRVERDLETIARSRWTTGYPSAASGSRASGSCPAWFHRAMLNRI